jgi:hypothetical protein
MFAFLRSVRAKTPWRWWTKKSGGWTENGKRDDEIEIMPNC